MIDLTDLVPAGAGVFWGQGAAEPTPLVDALLDQAAGIGGVTAFSGLSFNPRLGGPLPASLRLVSYGALGTLRGAAGCGQLEVIPCHLSALPRLFAERRLPGDVALVQVSPPDAAGMVSLGVGVDYVADALAHASTVVAEMNHRMPRTSGPLVPLGRFAQVVETDRPLPEAPTRAPDGVDLRIAETVAALVPDGATVQVGVGPLPSAVLAALRDHRALGLHSGLLTDGVVDLVERGVITGEAKEIDRGTAVTGAAFGSATLYDRLGAGDLAVAFRPVSYTHAPEVLGRLRSLVALNSGIEVDLTGQVGAEIRRGHYVGAVGGQADFSRAAGETGFRSILMLRSTSGGTSTIRATLQGGVVTTARADADAIATEHGVALLRGQTVAERATRLAAIAAPQFRDELARSARELGF